MDEEEKEVTLALLGQKMDTSIEEARQWRLEFASRMTQQDNRLQRFEDRLIEFDRLAATSVEERKSLWRELNSLKNRVLAWDMANTVGGLVLSTFYAVFVSKKP